MKTDLEIDLSWVTVSEEETEEPCTAVVAGCPNVFTHIGVFEKLSNCRCPNVIYRHYCVDHAMNVLQQANECNDWFYFRYGPGKCDGLHRLIKVIPRGQA